MTAQDITINADSRHYPFTLTDAHKNAFEACETHKAEIAAIAGKYGATGIVITAQSPARIEMGEAPMAFHYRMTKAEPGMRTGSQIAADLEQLIGVDFNPINPPRQRQIQKDRGDRAR